MAFAIVNASAEPVATAGTIYEARRIADFHTRTTLNLHRIAPVLATALGFIEPTTGVEFKWDSDVMVPVREVLEAKVHACYEAAWAAEDQLHKALGHKANA